MKIEWNKKYTTIAVYVFLTALAIGAALALIFNFIVMDFLGLIVSILSPFIVGFAVAYLLLPIQKFFENTVFGKIKPIANKKLVLRIISTSITYVIFLAILFLFAYIVLPELYRSLLRFLDNIESYAGTLADFSKNIFVNNDILHGIAVRSTDFLTDFSQKTVNTVLPYLKDAATGIFIGVKNFIIGVIVSFYMLFRRELFLAQTKKTVYALFNKKHADRLIYLSSLTNKSFSGFISGKLIDSLIIGLINYAVMAIFNWPYPVLISVIVGVTNIIPFFGPLIGAIPSALLILLENPWQAVAYVVFTVILQQLDGNIIGPKILGKSVGISAIWIVFAIIVGGGLFGFLGMVLGVPIFCVVYTVIKEFINDRLSKKNLSTDTEDYAE